MHRRPAPQSAVQRRQRGVRLGRRRRRRRLRRLPAHRRLPHPGRDVHPVRQLLGDEGVIAQSYPHRCRRQDATTTIRDSGFRAAFALIACHDERVRPSCSISATRSSTSITPVRRRGDLPRTAHGERPRSRPRSTTARRAIDAQFRARRPGTDATRQLPYVEAISMRSACRPTAWPASPPRLHAENRARFAVARRCTTTRPPSSPRCARAAFGSAWCRTPTAAFAAALAERGLSRALQRHHRLARGRRRKARPAHLPARPRRLRRRARRGDLRRRHLRDRRRRRAQRRHRRHCCSIRWACTARSTASASTGSPNCSSSCRSARRHSGRRNGAAGSDRQILLHTRARACARPVPDLGIT